VCSAYAICYMNTVKTWEFVSNSYEDTLNVGEKIAKQLKGGEVIELVSDVGGGKTAFVRGLARCIASVYQVASPTFTISRRYRSADSSLEIHHYDFYRLGNQPGIMQAELADSLSDGRVVTVVEWADAVQNVLPEDRLRIEIDVTGQNARHLLCSAGKSHQHLESK